MIAAFITLTISFFLAAAIILPLEFPEKEGCGRQKIRSERGARTGVLKKLKFHSGTRVKRKVFREITAPPREWKNQPLNKLKFYKNYIIKKAEITPIR